ncbi:MAG TPA: DNA polymerase III subunit gamma/tau C-terminal domain-containing protein, partial [Gallionellaceae bacterium]
MAIRSMAFDAALQDLATLLHRIALAQTVPDAIAEDEPERVRLMELAQQFSAEEVQLFYQIAIHGRNEINLAPDEYAGFTMTLLRMLAFMPAGTVQPVQASAMPVAAAAPAASAPALAVREPQATAPVAAYVATPAAGSGQLDWNVILGQLNVQGMARELARNCVLDSFVDGKLSLSVAPQHKQFLTNKIAQDKLQAALSEYFAQPVRLALAVGAPATAATPAAMEQQEKQVRQQAAEIAIEHDPFVREVQAQLDGELVENSVKFVQQ